MVDSIKVVEQLNKLAETDNNMWKKPTEEFGGVEAKNGALSGHDLLTKVIDPYFAKNPVDANSPEFKDLSFIKDPQVAKFIQENPDKKDKLIGYVNEYINLAKNSQGLPDGLADKTIALVDGLYTEKYADGKFNSKDIVVQAINEVSTGKMELLSELNSLSNTDYIKKFETLIGSDKVDGKISNKEFKLFEKFMKDNGMGSADLNNDHKVDMADMGLLPPPMVAKIVQTSLEPKR